MAIIPQPTTRCKPRPHHNPRTRHSPEPEVSCAHVSRIEPGEYHAFSLGAKVYWDGMYKRWVCTVRFNILDSALIETVAELVWHLNLGNGQKPHAGLRGNYRAEWLRANDGPPSRAGRMPHRVFTHRYALVRVDDTVKTFRQTATDERNRYSVVRGIVQWEGVAR